MNTDDCSKHTLVSHVAVLHHDSALLVKYRPTPDGQSGWFLPNDGLKHVEHPEEGAKRILRDQLGIEPSTLKLAQVESFVGNDKSWHLIFDFLAFPLSMNIRKALSVLDAQWFKIDKLPPASEFAHNGWGHSTLLKLAKAPL
ncbi:NUDIX hydrolase [Candidatus Bathyarchaeota archaeon]|nr:MAG: NUDIX hydrolase [Candidatus Bathyarchaeota archaeon]